MSDRGETPSRPARAWRRLVEYLFRQNAGTGRLAIAVGVGVFIGLTPLYGLHAILGIGAAWALRLNTAVTVLATQIANPLFAPVLIGASAWLGSLMNVSGTAAWYDPGHPSFYAAWLRGGLVLGLAMGALAGAATFVILGRVRRKRRA